MSSPLTWTLYLASAESQTADDAAKALADTIARYVDNQNVYSELQQW